MNLDERQVYNTNECERDKAASTAMTKQFALHVCGGGED